MSFNLHFIYYSSSSVLISSSDKASGEDYATVGPKFCRTFKRKDFSLLLLDLASVFCYIFNDTFAKVALIHTLCQSLSMLFISRN